jgi:hypothetical protein
MGGSGSGPVGCWPKKSTNDCLSLDIRKLYREGGADGILRLCSWCMGDKVSGSMCYTLNPSALHLFYTTDSIMGGKLDMDYLVPVTWTPCNYGGKRIWLICPGMVDRCGRRVAKLYLAQGQLHFLCRHCLDLTYQSRRDDASSRLMRKARDIRLRLGGTPNLMDPFPERPKGMHRYTYEQLRREGERFELELWAEIFYSLKRVRESSIRAYEKAVRPGAVGV